MVSPQTAGKCDMHAGAHPVARQSSLLFKVCAHSALHPAWVQQLSEHHGAPTSAARLSWILSCMARSRATSSSLALAARSRSSASSYINRAGQESQWGLPFSLSACLANVHAWAEKSRSNSTVAVPVNTAFPA